jgi:tetratricopeptide (TPR) repeat protein
MQKQGKRGLIKFIMVFFLLASIINMGASCNHENTSGSVFSQIGGVEEVTDEVTTYNTPEKNLSRGREYFESGDYDKALVSFQKVLVTNPNNDELAMAYSGIGWSRVKKSGSILDGEQDFENAYAARSTNQDAKVGLASIYLLKDSDHIREAISLLESLGMTTEDGISGVFDENFVYNSEIGTGISNARVHALLASCYYYNNESEKAKKQMSIAKALDPASDRIRSIETAIMTLGY